jgi:two-component system response regulator ChvI
MMSADANVKSGIHVLIVDDDALFRELVIQNLTDKDYRVTGFGDGASLFAALSGGMRADLILLDWIMPEMNGIEILRKLRSETQMVPVIFLTVLGDQVYEEAALLGGAVDFVEKSRSFSILLKRVEVALSRAKSHDAAPAPAGERMRYGDVELVEDQKRAFWKGQMIPLTLTEFNIVQHMIARAGKDLSYRELYDLVHGEGFLGGYGDVGYRTNVRALIKRVRQKFRDIDAGFDRIENYPGFGYRWRSEKAA